MTAPGRPLRRAPLQMCLGFLCRVILAITTQKETFRSDKNCRGALYLMVANTTLQDLWLAIVFVPREGTKG